MSDKRITNLEIVKELMNTNSKNNTQPIKDYSISIDISIEYWILKAGNFNPKVTTWALKNQFCTYDPQSKQIIY